MTPVATLDPGEVARRIRRQATVGVLGGAVVFLASLLSLGQPPQLSLLSVSGIIVGLFVLGISVIMMTSWFARRLTPEIKRIARLTSQDLARTGMRQARSMSVVLSIAFLLGLPVSLFLWPFDYLQPLIVGAESTTILFSGIFWIVYRRMKRELTASEQS